MPKVLNPELYEKAKQLADQIYKKPSAYKSGFIVKKYKELGSRYGDDDEPKNLKRWFKEKWGDVGNKSYPVYRPSVRISNKTSLTKNEIDPQNLNQQIFFKKTQTKGK